MLLQSLSISGFKSFALPTKIVLSPGVTAVVGPNGCGKSNIVDAVRWVLGEQRSSVLRGDRMDNVIFNGTKRRKPLGLSEVKLTIDNSHGILDVPFSEVEIARRLHRDGTSEYLLNGNACRLKDVSNLLHDSGMGPKPYTILELKMIEDILREEGEGRRMMFEEAAGVAKYKLRRRQALLKLQNTEEDLLRLADIIHEVERQVSSLKRQVARAKRHRKLSDQLKTSEAALMYLQHQHMLEELSPLERAMKEATTVSTAKRTLVVSEEAKLEKIRTKVLNTEKQGVDLRKRLEEVVSEISTLEAEEASLRAGEKAARNTIERTKREKILLTNRLELLENRRREAAASSEEQSDSLKTKETELQSTREALEAAEQHLHKLEADAEKSSARLEAVRSRISELEKEQGLRITQQATLSGRREALEQDLKSILSDIASTEEKREQLKLDKQTVQVDYDRLSERITEQSDYRDTITDDLDELQRRKLRTETNIQSIRSKLDLFAALEEKGPRGTEALRTLKNQHVEGLISLLGDSVDVDEKYRPAFQSILGPAAHYYLARSEKAVQDALEVLVRVRSGQATFIAADQFKENRQEQVSLPEGALGYALDFLNNASEMSVLEHFLSNVVLVPDWKTVLINIEWAKRHKMTLLSLDGQWWSSRGIMKGGSEARIPVDLGLGKQVEQFKLALEAKETELGGIESDLREKVKSLDESRKTLNNLQEEHKAKLTELHTLREQEVRSETILKSLSSRKAFGNEKLQAIDRELSSIEERIRNDAAAVAHAKEELGAELKTGNEMTRALADARVTVSSLRDVFHETEKSRNAAAHRLELLEAELRRIDQTKSEINDTLRDNELAETAAEKEVVETEKRLKEIDGILRDRYRLRDERAKAVDEFLVNLDQDRQEVRSQEEKLKKLRSDHDLESEGERKLEVQVARLRGEIDALLTTARDRFGFDMGSPSFIENHPEFTECETSIDHVQLLKEKLDRLGPVNLLAIEEYESENARLESLLVNRDDLLKAKKTLEETITHINETAQTKFLSTFEAVRGNFQQLFTDFFPAGEADLILSGKDLLEADITVWANPSGKRLKSLSLMSGGEKTMTAIALLFSLYRVKPSPFCFLDEVDAPLDDTNIDRFTSMIRKHSVETQFILVTHNKRTMEIADNLYGVTMEEEGISKIVSVRLEPAAA